jgi:hypothetical protein
MHLEINYNDFRGIGANHNGSGGDNGIDGYYFSNKNSMIMNMKKMILKV